VREEHSPFLATVGLRIALAAVDSVIEFRLEVLEANLGNRTPTGWTGRRPRPEIAALRPRPCGFHITLIATSPHDGKRLFTEL